MKLPKFLILRLLYKCYSQNFLFSTLFTQFLPQNFGLLRPLLGPRPGAAALLCPLITPLCGAYKTLTVIINSATGLHCLFIYLMIRAIACIHTVIYFCC